MHVRKKIALIVVLVAGLSFFHYASSLHSNYEHIFFRDLYFLPIILAGFWFGLRGALWTSLSITFIYLPFAVLYWGNFSPNDFDKAMEMLLYNVVAFILGVLKDREQAERLRVREAEDLAAMGKAVSSVAHDMKTPLMAIGGFTSLVQRKLKCDDPSYEKLDIVIRETRRLENMVREMLDFSRPLQLRPDETDINKTIRHSVDVVSQAPESGKIALEVHASDGIPAAAFDALRMEQVLINLLMNAIQASPEGGRISVRTSQEGDYARIDVEDAGGGLSPGDEENLFSPFFTTKKDGTGLGLPIVKKIVEAQGGEVSFRPNPKKGMTFTVKIPLRIQL